MDLKLNDFEGFNRYLFGEEEPDWSKFHQKEWNVFIPSIEKPETKVEHQLCHYALWMVISNCSPTVKPVIKRGMDIRNRCYACTWKNKINKFGNCVNYCPLTSLTRGSCSRAWFSWVNLLTHPQHTDSEVEECRKLAEEIAKIPWK